MHVVTSKALELVEDLGMRAKLGVKHCREHARKLRARDDVAGRCFLVNSPNFYFVMDFESLGYFHAFHEDLWVQMGLENDPEPCGFVSSSYGPTWSHINSFQARIHICLAKNMKDSGPKI